MTSLTLSMLCHCARVPDVPVPPPANVVRILNPPATAALPAPPFVAPESARATRGTFSGIAFEGVSFDSRSQRLVVLDQPAGPGSRFADAAAAALTVGGLAAVNAGFFTPAGEPLGLVVSGGKRSGTWNAASSLGGGVWHENSSGTSSITRREALGKSIAGTMRELIQAGPMLIENGRAVSGLDSTKESVRTFMLWDGGTRWWIGRASACSLAKLATTISHARPAAWPVRHALNLDGGRSADLWISDMVDGGPVSSRAPWNRQVRNFLVLKGRGSGL